MITKLDLIAPRDDESQPCKESNQGIFTYIGQENLG